MTFWKASTCNKQKAENDEIKYYYLSKKLVLEQRYEGSYNAFRR